MERKKDFKERLRIFEEKMQEARRFAQNKTDSRDRRINLEIAEQKRRESYAKAVSKKMEQTEER